tara:strand:- start:325 stop:546 length:222 start_codon:yes stop_codon:yes gene_type:complete
MGVKKYLAYSFATLWTLVLIAALVAALIHQVRFQDSPGQLKLEAKIMTLERQATDLEAEYYQYRQMWDVPMWE